MAHVLEALVSGSLGQALYLEDETLRILDAPDAEAREPLPNEVYWFRRAAREVASADPDGLPIPVEIVRRRLEEETRFFTGLDGLLVGMDRDMSSGSRRRAIRRAEAVLSADSDVARRIRHRFLVPVNSQEWDAAGALSLSLEAGAQAAADCYRPLAEGIVDKAVDEINSAILEKVGSGIEAADTRKAFLRSGIVAEIVLGEPGTLSSLHFRRGEFAGLRAVDPSGQLLAAVVRRLGPLSSTLHPVQTSIDDKAD